MVKRQVDDIIKSEQDNRLYRGLVLDNDLKILIISDPSTDKAAAALIVNVGYLSDPEELPGLAHFCEHMLFLGTEKYPCENEYSKFLSEHGGASNACTSPDNTCFYFDIIPEHLEGALDRFSQFFVAPLFTESATDREVCAVHAEHEKNIQNDMWRLHQLEQSTSKPDHPYCKFGTGNKKTLDEIPKAKGINPRDELLKFHKKWYSSNIMNLVILGKDELDVLQEMVERMFSGVENKNVTAPVWPDHPFGHDEVRLEGRVVPVKDTRSLVVTFPVPDLRKYYATPPDRYISHLLGHEGPGSLLSVLKTRGFCSSLEGGYRSGARGFSFIVVSTDLTEFGIRNTNKMIDYVFQYINMLKAEGPKEWIFKEYTRLAAMHFRFKDKEVPRNYVATLVGNLNDYPMEQVLVGGYAFKDWKPELISEILEYLDPQNCRIGIVGKSLATEVDQVEPWYGTQYTMNPITPELLGHWAKIKPCPQIKMPVPNVFVPENFDLMPKEENPSPYPTIILDSSLLRVWFKQDDEFFLPKANLSFELISPLAYVDPLHANLMYLYVMLVRDSLTEYAYDAELAGLRWDLIGTKYGLVLTVDGFSDKQPVLLAKIVERMVNFEVDEERFDIWKENYERGLKNFKAEQPYQNAMYYSAVLLSEQAWTKDELLEASKFVTIEKLEDYIPQFLSMVHIETLIHGNVDKKAALQLAQIMEDKFGMKILTPLLPPHLLRGRELRLDDACNFRFEVTNETHSSSCAELYYQCTIQSTRSNILVELLVQIIAEPCFKILRTQEQLGYIVATTVRVGHSIQGIRFIVQSNRHPEYVDGRIEAFIATMKDHLAEMSEEDFNVHKDALAAIRLEKPKKLTSKTARYWSEINSQQYNFERDVVEVAYLRSVNKDDVFKFFMDYLSKGSEQRHKLAVHVLSIAEGGAGCPTEESTPEPETPDPGTPEPEPSATPETLDVEVSVIEDITCFKGSQGYFPLVKPSMNIKPKGTRAKL